MVEVVDDAMEVRRGVNVFVPVTPGREAVELRETALEAEGVWANPDGVLGRKPIGVLGARYDFWLAS